MRTASTVLLWLGCGVAALAATQPWWNAGERTAVTGSQASGATLALILAAAAGGFLAVFLHGTSRRIVFALAALLATGAVPVALGASPVGVAVAGTGVTGAGDSFVASAWPQVYLVAVVAAALGAVGLAGARTPPRRPRATPDSALDAWKALDAGDDPTLSDRPDAAGGAAAERQE